MQYCEDPNCKDCHGPPGSEKYERWQLEQAVAAAKAAEETGRPKLPQTGVPIGRLRNRPCPCGSGKKFKKCCLGRVKAKMVKDGQHNARVEVPQSKEYHANTRSR